MKRSPLYYVVFGILIVSFILLAWPNIIGWGENNSFVGAIPVSQLCIYLFPLLIVLCMGGLYLIDYQFEKQKALARLAEQKAKGGDDKC